KRVEHARAFLAGRHEARPAQHTQLLRQVRELDPDDRLQVADGTLTFGQYLEHADAGRVGECLEQVGLDRGQGHGGTRGRWQLLWHMTNLSSDRACSALSIVDGDEELGLVTVDVLPGRLESEPVVERARAAAAFTARHEQLRHA